MADTPSAPTRQLQQQDGVLSAPARAVPSPEPAGPVLVEEELLVEEISIDGMCGVY